MQNDKAYPWYALPTEDVYRLLETNKATGLTEEEVRARIQQLGPNIITKKKKKSALIRFMLQFHNPLLYVLLSASLITAFLHEWIDSGVILAVVIINAIIGFIQESKAEKAMEALEKMIVTKALVLRKGEKKQVSSIDIVPGDVVLLSSGDKVPADIRLITTHDLNIDESSLTGESFPVTKIHTPLPEDTHLADRKNMVYLGTLVTYGRATGIVTSTGDKTEIGHISELISGAGEISTPLTKKMAQFSKMLSIGILFLSVVVFIIGYYTGHNLLEMFMATISMAVAAVPEGLPAILTITLAIGVTHMAKKKAIIRKLPAVETLGSTTVICSDKTGTLTENQMTVSSIMAEGRQYEVTGSGYTPSGEIRSEGVAVNFDQHPTLKKILYASMLCNDSRLFQGNNIWQIEGDPTEGALIVAARKGGFSEETASKEMPRIDTVPFESERQYMATLHHGADGSTTVFLKGAVERVLGMCSTSPDGSGGEKPLLQDEILALAEKMAKEGLRVLAFAEEHIPDVQKCCLAKDLEYDLTFLGLVAMLDPPRPEVIEAVSMCHRAGIKVKMITGDHPATALAIAKQIGINGVSSHNGLLTGQALEKIADKDLPEKVMTTNVFARVSPKQKLRIVNALQKKNQIVAMTGDGVNDAPALKQADIGVAMGLKGTEVAKEASDIVLMDDNFATIVAAAEEGRSVFNNLMKCIVWTLPTNGGEAFTIITAIALGQHLPMLPVQLLWVNMITAVTLGLTPAFEPQEMGLMEIPPRSPESPILTPRYIFRIILVSILVAAGTVGLFLWNCCFKHMDLAHAQTIAVSTLVFYEIFYLFNCRSLSRTIFKVGIFSNRTFWTGIVIMILAQLGFTYLPIMNTLFHSKPMAWADWTKVLLVTFPIYFIIGLEKWLWRKKRLL